METEMPSAVVKSYASRSDHSLADIERYWDEAKADAKKKFKKKSPRYWAYVNAITKRRAGLDENLSFKQFLELVNEETATDKPDGFCPACGEPEREGRIHHDPSCPYAGDDIPPEEAGEQ